MTLGPANRAHECVIRGFCFDEVSPPIVALVHCMPAYSIDSSAIWAPYVYKCLAAHRDKLAVIIEPSPSLAVAQKTTLGDTVDRLRFVTSVDAIGSYLAVLHRLLLRTDICCIVVGSGIFWEVPRESGLRHVALTDIEEIHRVLRCLSRDRQVANFVVVPAAHHRDSPQHGDLVVPGVDGSMRSLRPAGGLMWRNVFDQIEYCCLLSSQSNTASQDP